MQYTTNRFWPKKLAEANCGPIGMEFSKDTL